MRRPGFGPASAVSKICLVRFDGRISLGGTETGAVASLPVHERAEQREIVHRLKRGKRPFQRAKPIR